MAAASDHRLLVGAKIRQRRIRAGLSQEAVAEKAGMHPNYYGRIERGEEYASLTKLRDIARALGVRVRVLVWDL